MRIHSHTGSHMHRQSDSQVRSVRRVNCQSHMHGQTDIRVRSVLKVPCLRHVDSHVRSHMQTH